MKKALIVLLGLALLFNLAGCASAPSSTVASEPPAASTSEAASVPVPDSTPEAPANPVIRLSTTTSVNDSGLLPYLQPYFEEDTGYTLEVTSAGTGAAIEKGRTGDADALLVHAKASEEEFISEGYAPERIPFMYNFFVILGPENDPAGVADAANATEAFKAIADGGYTFISRGDDSGTHKAELKIWEAAGIEPNPESDTWYVSAGDGMGACINMASEQQAYVLSDKATYLSHELRDSLVILMEESDEMKNTYSMLAISPDKWPDTNIDGANAFIEWMTSDKAKELIDAYGVEEYGEQLFFTM
ncbi:substrate-binding domain-containing protein [Ruminococcaceae bacterium OttesenSCG-928-A11]|nr:substrate-binding domain-containing protein [Ruminococcaceae bacterium OttesenSCG-928-A11]